LCDRSAVLYFAPLDVLLIAKEEGTTNKEEGRRKKEEGKRKKEEGRRKKEEVTGNCAK